MYKYITDKFGEIYAQKFRRNLIEFCHLLTKQPLIGRPSKNDETLSVFIFSKQNKIVYKVEDNNITIIRILSIKTNLSSKY
ncbi:type II toxin-antitoxin system RelE/ParE family toxin [Terrimonas sp.]|uniref:type II toxin-antitoxin system RelE/ParE family toxin n=1 Tax=Terrimonas sp. TaxID=1914338 RepID=UPI00351A4F2E